jgi:hypothetical protein
VRFHQFELHVCQHHRQCPSHPPQEEPDRLTNRFPRPPYSVPRCCCSAASIVGETRRKARLPVIARAAGWSVWRFDSLCTRARSTPSSRPGQLKIHEQENTSTPIQQLRSVLPQCRGDAFGPVLPDQTDLLAGTYPPHEALVTPEKGDAVPSKTGSVSSRRQQGAGAWIHQPPPTTHHTLPHARTYAPTPICTARLSLDLGLAATLQQHPPSQQPPPPPTRCPPLWDALSSFWERPSSAAREQQPGICPISLSLPDLPGPHPAGNQPPSGETQALVSCPLPHHSPFPRLAALSFIYRQSPGNGAKTRTLSSYPSSAYPLCHPSHLLVLLSPKPAPSCRPLNLFRARHYRQQPRRQESVEGSGTSSRALAVLASTGDSDHLRSSR